MIFLVASTDQVIEIEAPSAEAAMDHVAARLFVTEYQKEHGNLSAIPKPRTPLDLKEIIRKLTISTGEHLEYYGYPNGFSQRLLDYLKELPDPSTLPRRKRDEPAQLNLIPACGRCGAERNEDGSAVLWKCQMCDIFVCQKCTLTIPRTRPIEYYWGTFCSQECHVKAGSPQD